MKVRIEFNEEKNILLKETRGVCFEDVIKAVEEGRVLAVLRHRDQKKYPNQRILVIKIKNYAHAVPYVINKRKGVIFLKTVYPSRFLTDRYLGKKGL
jgi:uncharacterized DUF497 family protein